MHVTYESIDQHCINCIIAANPYHMSLYYWTFTICFSIPVKGFQLIAIDRWNIDGEFARILTL